MSSPLNAAIIFFHEVNLLLGYIQVS